MAKSFAPRVSKSQRKKIDIQELIGRDVFKMSDQKLLQGARLDEIRLSSITVKGQVRTKFDDSSIRDLAENIKINGLIQPLVVHDDGGTFRLICGERRHRAMTLIEQESAPCFIIENKTEDELMAIQFSENSSREELHYIDKADGILNYQQVTKASERKIQKALGISKSEVHRSLLIARLPDDIKEAAKQYDIEKYVLLEFDAIDESPLKDKIEREIIAGQITRRAKLKTAIRSGGIIQASKRPRREAGEQRVHTKQLSAAAFIKAINQQSKKLDIDENTQKLLKSLVEETKEMMDI